MKDIYIVTEYEDRFPIIVSSSFEKAKKLLDKYTGVNNEDIIDLGYKEYKYSEYEDSYMGYFSYNIKYRLVNNKFEICNFKIYKLKLDTL